MTPLLPLPYLPPNLSLPPRSTDKEDWLKSINKANPEVLPSIRDAFMHQLFPMEKSACPFQEFMDVVFRQDVASYNRLLNRGCRLDRRETWGNVSSTIGGDWE